MWLCEKDTERCNIAGFEDWGRVPWAKEYEWPQEVGKGKEADYPL